MFIYDKAHDLAKEIKSSDDYKEYARLKKIVTADDKTKALLADYKKYSLKLRQAC